MAEQQIDKLPEEVKEMGRDIKAAAQRFISAHQN